MLRLGVFSPMAAKKMKSYDHKQEVRAIARERVGTVKSSRAIQEKTRRDKPKHKQPLDSEGSQA
jgi:hypothetical protein